MENQMNIASVEEKTPEQIEAEMMATRESLSEKVAALENTVVDTVQNAAHTLTETVDAVKSFVTHAPEAVEERVEQVASAVKESVIRTFDISSRVAANPWTSLGVSMGAGFLTGYLLFPSSRSSRHAAAMTTTISESSPPLHPNPYSTTQRPGLFDDVMTMVGRKLKDIAQTAIESASTSLNEAVRDAVPRIVNEASQWVAAGAGQKVGEYTHNHGNGVHE